VLTFCRYVFGIEKIEVYQELKLPQNKLKPRADSVVPSGCARQGQDATSSVDASANPQRVKRLKAFSIFDILNINPSLSHYGIGRW
jgi:hypothetical protein